jgi:hypothetical protein
MNFQQFSDFGDPRLRGGEKKRLPLRVRSPRSGCGGLSCCGSGLRRDERPDKCDRVATGKKPVK